MPDFVDSVFNAASSSLNTVSNVTKTAASTVYGLIPNSPLENWEITPIVATPPPEPSIFSIGINKMTDVYHKNPQLTKWAFYIIIPMALRSILTHPVRRANRLLSPVIGNGTTRFEVVLIIGQPDSPFISKLIHDLNKRGYVVYVTVENEKELQMIESTKDNDIRHLWIDWSSDTTVKSSLLKLAKVLDTAINSSNDTLLQEESFYNFKAVLFAPNYSHLPKAAVVTDIHTKELQRVMDTHFAKLNTLLYNGLSTIMTESNIRRDELWIANGFNMDLSKEPEWKQYVYKPLQVAFGVLSSIFGLNALLCPGGVSKGGATKLLWLNFLVQYSSPTVNESDYGISSSSYLTSIKTKLIIQLLYSMNNSYFKVLNSDMGPSFLESMFRSIGIIRNPFQLDMAMVNVDIIKGHGGFTKHKGYNDSGYSKYSIFGNLNKVVSTTGDSLYEIGKSVYHHSLHLLAETFDLFYDGLCYFVSIFSGSNSGGRRRGVNPRRVHYLIFDLINSSSLSSEYWIS